jgi:hypothetical protein
MYDKLVADIVTPASLNLLFFREVISAKVHVIRQKSSYTIAEIKKRFPGEKLCLCDFALLGAENKKVSEDLSITIDEDLLLVDHHVPLETFTAHISSTTIACNYARAHGPLPNAYKVVINHTDTDSLLSMLVMLGLLKPEEKYNQAALAADHTGENNEIADLLQVFSTHKDFHISIQNLLTYLKTGTYSEKQLALVNKRNERYELAADYVNNGKVKMYRPGLAYVVIKERLLKPIFFKRYLPEVKVLMVCRKLQSKNWEIRIRLFDEGSKVRLNKVHLKNFGGRWNAGANRRSGGSNITPYRYVKSLWRQIEDKLS